MALIDSTYFVGELNIPSTDTERISERLSLFIEKYEPELLRDILGLDLYNAFFAGLQEVTVAAKWTDLLYGKEYTYQSKSRRYQGLISIEDALNPGTYMPTDISFTIDSTQAAAGQYINAFLTGTTYRIVQRGVGPLLTSEYTLNADGFSKPMVQGEVYTIEFTAPVPLPLPATNITVGLKQSLIANYIYWHWLEDSTTQAMTLGVQKAKAENATSASPYKKMVRTWNDMSDWIYSLHYYLRANKDTYTEWREDSCEWYSSYGRNVGKYSKQNVFGI